MRQKSFLLATLLFAALLALPSTVSAQYTPIYNAGTAVGDTLLNQDTVYYYLVAPFSNASIAQNAYRSDLTFIVNVAQLTGTAAGTVDLQVALPPSDRTSNTNSLWYSKTSQNLTSGASVSYYFNSEFLERRARVRVITSSGSRTLKVRVEGALRRRTF